MEIDFFLHSERRGEKSLKGSMYLVFNLLKCIAMLMLRVNKMQPPKYVHFCHLWTSWTWPEADCSSSGTRVRPGVAFELEDFSLIVTT